jgi:lipoprotein signal peptidase
MPMKKKKKQKVIVITMVLAFVFPIMVKVLDLDSSQMTTCVMFYGLVVNLYSNFNFGEALLVKLSIIT